MVQLAEDPGRIEMATGEIWGTRRAVAVMLSFIGEASDHEAQIMLTHLTSPSPYVRAAALCVLAGKPSFVGPADLARSLGDSSRYVRAAAVHFLERNPSV
jgi:HEAT repeat protein